MYYNDGSKLKIVLVLFAFSILSFLEAEEQNWTHPTLAALTRMEREQGIPTKY